MNVFFQGFMLGLAYVMPIGMQNLYVINTAISKSRLRAIEVALITIFFDIALALSCYFGIGILLEKIPVLKIITLGIGSIAVIFIGFMLFKSKHEKEDKLDLNKSLWQIVLTCFAVTWLNPQAIIDGTLLLSGFRAILSGQNVIYFIIGVSAASFTWFMSLSIFISKFKNSFSSNLINIINKVCGIILIGFGIKLALNFFA
ncbi:LysE/ArgO family amino acid transporter [Helicovermis profundi]|uniref:LysE/ArgO family amino acid transporter n=1 Tax=Helicovermis profundi TaxID=3065157 RepID=A0AAU9ED60_9FIRM|nr:LysE/ArgO family amino acid transporter [Clostridia bacterium S502]